MKARRTVRRHPAIFYAAGTVLAFLVAYYIGNPLFSQWTPVRETLSRWIMTSVGDTSGKTEFRHVRMLVIDKDTDVAALAQGEGFTDVDRANYKSVRRLHGRMLEKLAEAEPRAVTIALAFDGETEFDAEIIQGIKSLADHNIPVVFATSGWHQDPEFIQPLVREGVGSIRWGCIAGTLDNPDEEWRCFLAIRRGAEDPQPSMALSTVTSYRRPDHNAAVQFDDGRREMSIAYWRPDPNWPQKKKWDDSQDRLTLSESVRHFDGDKLALNQLRDDRVATYICTLPDVSVLQRSTVRYADTFGASLDERKSWFKDRAVVIGDVSFPAGWSRHVSGRTLSYLQAHASWIESILDMLAFGNHGNAVSAFWPTLLFSIVGFYIGSLLWLYTGWRILAVAFVSVLALAGSFWLAAVKTSLTTPEMPAVALAIGAELTAGVKRTCLSRFRV